MSRTMLPGDLRSWIRSIQVPDRSVKASRLTSVASHSVSNRPIWLLEAAARSSLTADDGPHRGITGEALGVVDILVAGHPPKHRLPKQPAQCVARVLAASTVQEFRDRDLGEPESIVELTVGEQPTVGGDPGTVEFELDPAVESGSQRQLSGFTRRVPHDHAPSVVPTR
jgi:hypothetical protein